MRRCCMKQPFAMVLFLWSSIMVRVSSSTTTATGTAALAATSAMGGRRSVLAFAAFNPSPQRRSTTTRGLVTTTATKTNTFSRFHTLLSSTTDRNTNINSNPNLQQQQQQQPYSSTTTPLFLEEDDTFQRPQVNWYPGHIAKAERQLSETLKVVDVVVEVRDARASKASSHPRVGEWCAGRPRIVVLTHIDQIPKSAAASWKRAYDTFGAHGTMENEVLNYAQIWNQAKQNKENSAKFNPHQQPNNNNNKRKNQQQQGKNKQQQQEAVISPVEQVLFVNAKQGQGIHALHRAIFKAGSHVQERRDRRGLKERPLRVGIIGYPNVGKSALINRILGRKRAKTANTPGVTRSLQWIRVRTDEDISTSTVSGSIGRNGSTTTAARKKREFELLDSPGIIPAKMVDQSDAILLAACNCIGQAAYDNQGVASYLFEWLKTVHLMGKGDVTAPQWRTKCLERYGFDPLEEIPIDTTDFHGGVGDETDMSQSPSQQPTRLRTGEDMLFQVADNTCRGDPEDASRKILQDFRTGRLGLICLQVAPQSEDDAGQVHVPVARMDGLDHQRNLMGGKLKKEQLQQERQERARLAVEVAKTRGLELPPTIKNDNDNESDKADESTVGKGLFDGW